MNIFMNVLVVALPLAILFASHIIRCELPWSWRLRGSHEQLLQWGGYSLALLILLSPAVYEYPGMSMVLYEKHADGRMEAKPYGAWQAGKTLVYIYRDPEHIRGSVQSITENPKVKTIEFYLSVSVVDPIVFVNHFSCNPKAVLPSLVGTIKADRDSGCVTRAAQSIAFVFKDENSRKMSRLNNPMDDLQQKEFQKLAQEWLGPRLAKVGLKLNSAKFRMDL